MSSVVYQAIKKNLEETLKEGIEKGRKETTEKMAVEFLMRGGDPDIIAAATGYTMDELMSLMVSAVR